MNIKKVVKLSFFAIIVFIIIIASINVFVIYKIKNNNETLDIISKIITIQNEMNYLSKDLINIKSHKELIDKKNNFKIKEKRFEYLKEILEFKNSNNLLHIYFIELYNNEKKIENIFDNLIDIREEEISLKKEFIKTYPLEKNIRMYLEKIVLSKNDITLLLHLSNLKYYSKEAIFQHKNKKYFDKWIKQIDILKNIIVDEKWDEYELIVRKLKLNIIKTKKLKNNSDFFYKKILDVVSSNTKINNTIKINNDKIFINFTNKLYVILFVLLLLTIIVILILEYKVYKSVDLSVDEIESKVNDGLKTINELNIEMETTQKEVVFTMGAIGESRSKETGNHVKRVAEYSKLLASLYGKDKQYSEMLKQASPMHDIGKVAIPDAILNKPGRFNDDERKIMDTHAQLGYDMLKHSNRSLLKMAATIAYTHHEKWDGSGYPNSLKKEEIDISGRITALADVFDALGSDRVYKKAWSDEKIFSLLKEEKGKHFDPKLIDIFFDNLSDFLKIRDSFKDIF